MNLQTIALITQTCQAERRTLPYSCRSIGSAYLLAPNWVRYTCYPY